MGLTSFIFVGGDTAAACEEVILGQNAPRFVAVACGLAITARHAP
jgi:hypothetical protein